MKYNPIKRGGAFAFAILFSIFVLCAFPAKAQRQNAFSTPVVTGLVVPQSGTTNLATPLFIDASGSQVITFWSDSTTSVFVNTNCQFLLAPTGDGIHMDTNATVTIYGKAWASVTNLNTPSQYAANVTNITCGALQGYYLYEIVEPTGAGNITNNLSYTVKLGAP